MDGDAEFESGVTNQSSDGPSENIFDGYSSDSHQHYGLGPEPCCQQEEVEPEEDSERDPEEVHVSNDQMLEPEVIVIPDSPDPPVVQLLYEVVVISSDSEEEESPIRTPFVSQVFQSHTSTPEQVVPEITLPPSVDPYSHSTEYWERYMKRLRQSESYQDWHNRDAPQVIQDFPPVPTYTHVGNPMEIRNESYGISEAVQDSRAPGPSRGYEI
ncbi:unnamed protein product [Arabis nemorensis]|uniref:Uncharacterized protein n=1 Tax=Arabis nemorensis TaxID=586526 RepID=A0A565CP97_9BRAS|nr:unnamed protein product [Arabis nemorensis]